jgi:hypothetical protein
MESRCRFGAIEFFRQQATRLQVPGVDCLIAQAIINQIHQSMHSALLRIRLLNALPIVAEICLDPSSLPRALPSLPVIILRDCSHVSLALRLLIIVGR